MERPEVSNDQMMANALERIEVLKARLFHVEQIILGVSKVLTQYLGKDKVYELLNADIGETKEG